MNNKYTSEQCYKNDSNNKGKKIDVQDYVPLINVWIENIYLTIYNKNVILLTVLKIFLNINKKNKDIQEIDRLHYSLLNYCTEKTKNVVQSINKNVYNNKHKSTAEKNFIILSAIKYMHNISSTEKVIGSPSTLNNIHVSQQLINKIDNTTQITK